MHSCLASDWSRGDDSIVGWIPDCMRTLALSKMSFFHEVGWLVS